MKRISTYLVNYLVGLLSFLVLINSVKAQLVPITLTLASFNHDFVAEGAGNDPTLLTTTSVYFGSDYVLFDATYRGAHDGIITDGGLPATGTINNGPDVWQLNSYSGNNALVFAPQSDPSSSTLSLTVPAQYSKISLLCASVNGPLTVNITVNFSDLSSTNLGAFALNNWVSITPNVIQGIGAIVRTNTVTVQQGTPNDPRLYQLDLSLSPTDQVKNVTSILVGNLDVTNSVSAVFFAASGIPAGILPITFSSLKGEYKSSENKIDLTWQAESSLISPGFEVERSADGHSFSSIAMVPPQKNLGTSTYSYSDFNLQNRQTWFYRIKETLAGGVINYSRIINVKTSAAASFRIIQSGGYIRLVAASPEKSYRYKIFDLRGRELKSGTISLANQYSIDVRNLPSGPYTINFLDQTQTRALRFIK